MFYGAQISKSCSTEILPYLSISDNRHYFGCRGDGEVRREGSRKTAEDGSPGAVRLADDDYLTFVSLHNWLCPLSYHTASLSSVMIYNWRPWIAVVLPDGLPRSFPF